MARYENRRVVNEHSRDTAENFRTLWDAEEIQLLEENWDGTSLEDIAAALGRTVEACRQKHYDLKNIRETKEKVQRVTTWTKGFTNLSDMGY